MILCRNRSVRLTPLPFRGWLSGAGPIEPPGSRTFSGASAVDECPIALSLAECAGERTLLACMLTGVAAVRVRIRRDDTHLVVAPAPALQGTSTGRGRQCRPGRFVAAALVAAASWLGALHG